MAALAVVLVEAVVQQLVVTKAVSHMLHILNQLESINAFVLLKQDVVCHLKEAYERIFDSSMLIIQIAFFEIIKCNSCRAKMLTKHLQIGDGTSGVTLALDNDCFQNVIINVQFFLAANVS